MLDIKYIRENPAEAKAGLLRVGDSDSVDKLLEFDSRRRDVLNELEELRNRRNVVSKEIGACKDQQERESKIAAMKEVGNRIKELEEELAGVEERFVELQLSVPNIPAADVPDGAGEEGNRVSGEYGEIPQFDFEVRPHWELGEALNGIDFERGVKISGTRFYLLKGQFAALQRALISFMLDLHTRQHGFEEIYPPYMVKEECLYGTGNLPKFGDNLYRDAEENFYFIPTAEVPVTNMYRGEILSGENLPVKHVAYTACFRREKMSAGKDTRGIKRGHQFDKVEMVAFVKPEESAAMYEELIANAAKVLELLELPYRRLEICAGDLSFTAAAKVDLEVWAAGCNEWLEVSSISNFHSFQALRAGIRFRREAGAKPEFVHTLNGSGLALPRVLIALLENNQQADGRIRIPQVLRPWMGGLEYLG